jgi:glycosyltransferase involved in cell wall biosynthesis
MNPVDTLGRQMTKRACGEKYRMMPMSQVRVMHMIDTLDAGGAERVAVNLANVMPRDRFRTYLCTTRREGPLAELLAPDVGRLNLERKRTLQWRAIRRLVSFVRREQIQILHAHEYSLFFAVVASLFPPFPAVVWHDNFGPCETEERPVWIYRLLARRLRAVIAVNQPLVDWSRNRLRVPHDRVWFLKNFVCRPKLSGNSNHIPGSPGARIACVANLRPQKDHVTLIRAMALVVKQVPNAHLLLIGSRNGPDDTHDLVRRHIHEFGLEPNVSLLGRRDDVADVLSVCDVGVLSSVSEGCPLALLEYGMSGLPVVATSVGECSDLLDQGKAGLLVPPKQAERLADCLLQLLTFPDRRVLFGDRLQQRVREAYGEDAAIEQVAGIYNSVLGGTGTGPMRGERPTDV